MSEKDVQEYYWENRSLFSDYFLNERLNQSKDWKDDVSGPFQTIQAIYNDKKEILSTLNEAQTEKEFIRNGEDGNTVRTTQPVYRFELSDSEGRYWQQAFEVLGDFENSSNFPGGKIRTTHEKLMGANVPVFDDKADIEPLIELREELAEVEARIEKTDWLIDQVVYRLYGLTEEEVKVVEGGEL